MTNNKPAFIATVIVALVAVAVAVFAFWKIAQDKQETDLMQTDKNATYIPTEEISEEMKDAAELLIRNNYAVVKLYYTRGLPHEEEPYGNRPEGGVYFVDSQEYKTLDDVQKILDETFFEEEASRIKSDPHGYGPVYLEREGRLGISESFTPDTDYPVNWENPSYEVKAKSDIECTLEVTLLVNETEATEKVTMMKLNGEWRLERIIV